MPAATDRIEFTPPPAPGRLPAFMLALLAHVLLMLALTWGITWNRDPQSASAEAELWAKVPQEAAPAATAPPPPPAPVVQAPPLPPPPPVEPPPQPRVEPPAPPVEPEQPDIALEQEKRRQQEAERRRAELEQQKKLEARKREEELEQKRELEARKRQEELERQQLEARRKKEEQEKRELAERKAAEKKRQEELAKAKAREEEQAKRLQTLREENLKRMQTLATGSGGPSAAGTAARSAGPSDSYAGRVQARVRPNIVFADDVRGNPKAEVEVRMTPDGTITSRRILKSSGVLSWDEAVLRALDRTEVLPRDVDGRVPSPLIIEFRPKG